jgi:hypothetical protein
VFFSLIDELIIEIRHYRKAQKSSKLMTFLFPRKKLLIFNVQDKFQEIYSSSLEIINEASRLREYRQNDLNLNGFYKPENSNKKLIKNLINEAIELIIQDNSITEKSRKELIEYLYKVLKRLDSKYTNWSTIIGNITEIIIVLGALGSFIGGITPLLKAKEKLEESTKVIERTSININNNSYNDTFNIQNAEQLNAFNATILQLNETNPKLKEFE